MKQKQINMSKERLKIIQSQIKTIEKKDKIISRLFYICCEKGIEYNDKKFIKQLAKEHFLIYIQDKGLLNKVARVMLK